LLYFDHKQSWRIINTSAPLNTLSHKFIQWWIILYWVESSLMLWPTVSWPVCLVVKYSSGAYDQIFITVRQLQVCWCGALSLTRGWVCHLKIAVGPHHCSHFWAWVPCNSQPYVTVSDLRLSFLSPPTTCRAMVEVFDPASTQDDLISRVDCFYIHCSVYLSVNVWNMAAHIINFKLVFIQGFEILFII
jgi:hypothetical protein